MSCIRKTNGNLKNKVDVVLNEANLLVKMNKGFSIDNA